MNTWKYNLFLGFCTSILGFETVIQYNANFSQTYPILIFIGILTFLGYGYTLSNSVKEKFMYSIFSFLSLLIIYITTFNITLLVLLLLSGLLVLIYNSVRYVPFLKSISVSVSWGIVAILPIVYISNLQSYNFIIIKGLEITLFIYQLMIMIDFLQRFEDKQNKIISLGNILSPIYIYLVLIGLEATKLLIFKNILTDYSYIESGLMLSLFAVILYTINKTKTNSKEFLYHFAIDICIPLKVLLTVKTHI